MLLYMVCCVKILNIGFTNTGKHPVFVFQGKKLEIITKSYKKWIFGSKIWVASGFEIATSFSFLFLENFTHEYKVFWSSWSPLSSLPISPYHYSLPQLLQLPVSFQNSVSLLSPTEWFYWSAQSISLSYVTHVGQWQSTNVSNFSITHHEMISNTNSDFQPQPEFVGML